MSVKSFRRKHAACPFCKEKPLVTVQELSERLPEAVYIRHRTCPYCGKKIEVIMREYLGNEGQFQRSIHIRKPIAKEDDESKKKKRIIALDPQ